jgi:DNA-binding transcriptional ArsR family regulator
MTADRVGQVFSALADPTRRHLVESLARGSGTTTGLAGELPMTRQAVAKHLDTLRRAGLVRGTPSGREVVYELTPHRLREAARWMAELGAEWDERLARLAELYEARPGDPAG